jgi:MoaA/NifB/PqqE/SkfB family radical SAM enzyme
MSSAAEYLEDPFLRRLHEDIQKAGHLRTVSVDLTHVCNIRCQGCYFYAEDMDASKAPRDEGVFDAFVERERARGTNFMTVLGGEPSLMLERLQKLYEHFWLVVPTNGLRKIPHEGFEDLAVAVSVWGDHDTDKRLRGSGKLDVFAKGLENYKGDDRVFWYFVATAGNAHEIERVVDRCVENGNYVHFTFYGDIDKRGGALDHRAGFDRVHAEINRSIERYPDRILLSSYLSQVVTTGKLYDETWGYEVCTSCSVDYPANEARFRNGKPYNRHFNAYNPDLLTVRRCCVGEKRDCGTCFDVWSHYSWIMLNKHKHLGSKQEFTNWLTNMYLFYLANRIVDFKASIPLLPEIHARQSALRA